MLTNLEQLAEYCEKLKDELDQQVPALMFGSTGFELKDKMKMLWLLKELKNSAEGIAKFYGACENSLGDQINKQIEQMGLEQMDVKFGESKYRFAPETKYFINCKADAKPELIAWLKGHPIGRELVKEDVHPKTLEKFVKEDLVLQGQLPPPMVSIHEVQSVKMRKLPS
jgi:hypothetical protein